MKALAYTIALASLACLLAPSARAEEKKLAAKAVSEVEVKKDIAYYDGKDADAEKHKLDLYLPKGAKGFPVVVYVHGGGWSKGDRKNAARIGETLAKHGIGLASVGYRLSPKVQHPAHIQDVAKAFAWIHQNIAKYGGRPDALFISGHSAGGHLAALLATDESYLKAEKLSLKDIKGAIPISGVFRIAPGRPKGAFPDDAAECKKASPLTHVSGHEPPFLVLYGDAEAAGLGKQANEFSDALKKAKTETTCMEVKDRNHGTIVGKIPTEGDPTTEAILAFIAKHAGTKRAAK